MVTCAHVLDKQFGRAEPDPGRSLAAPAQVVEVEFPFADKEGSAGTRMRATVVDWVPIAADGSGDAALLELESELDLTPDLEPEPKEKESVAYTPAPLACPSGLSGHQFSVHGFPHGSPAAREVNGVLRGASGEEGPWVQLDPEGEAGWAIEVGFSGSPVFDKNREAVVGIVVIRDDHRTGHMIPMSYLRRLWPEVRSNCRWRLDLEASYRTHWRPRARGAEPASRTDEWFFTGRTEARRVIRDWLEGRAHAEHPIMLVTGGPGSGKSALLAHSLVASDPLLSRTAPTSGPCPPTGAFDAAVYLKGRTCDEMRAELARALDVTASNSDDLVAAVPEFPDDKRFTVLADAVEEAASLDEAVDMADLLSQLADTGRVRVLAAVRTTPAGAVREGILTTFGDSTPCIDLEDSQYLHRPDVSEYVARRLASEQANSARYRGYGPDQLRAIGEKVARKARYNFLIAQLTTGWLTDPRGQQSGPDDPGWEAELPQTVGQAMDRYLRTCRPNDAKVKRLLTALAYARGAGLPRGGSWLRVADALNPDFDRTARDRYRAFTTDDLATVFESAAQHLVERVDDGSGPHKYRLFHDALDQHLRKTLKHHAPEAAIMSALTDAVPCGRDGERTWAEADAYTRDHLASHAAAGEQLDTLLTTDIEYLVHATPRGLTPHLHLARSEAARLVAAVYRTSLDIHINATSAVRRQVLALDAARAGATSLKSQLARRIPAGSWEPLWATGNGFAPAVRDTFTTGQISPPVACSVVNGTPVAVTGGQDGVVRVWDLATGAPIGPPLTGHTEWVRAVECSVVNGAPVAVTSSEDGTVRVWDLSACTPFGPPLTVASRMNVHAVACTVLDGASVAVTGDLDGVVQVWDLATGATLGEPLPANPPTVLKMACTEVDGVPVAVFGGHDGVVWVWDLISRVPLGKFSIGPYRVNAISCTEVNGTPVAVTISGVNFRVEVWDLASRARLGQLMIGYTGEVLGVTCTVVEGTPVAVITSDDRAVRVWDLNTCTQLGQPLTGHAETARAVACTMVGGTPVAVTTSIDRTARVWDLASGTSIGQPLTGHTQLVHAVTCTMVDGTPIAVTTSSDRTARVWDLASRAPLGKPLTGHTANVTRVACGVVDGIPVAVTSGSDSVRAWNLATRTALGQADYTGLPNALSCTVVGGIPVAVIVPNNSLATTVEIRSLKNGMKLGQFLIGNSMHATGACTVVDGTPVAVIASGDGRLQVWDLATCTLLREVVVFGQSRMPMTVYVACTVMDGTPVAAIATGNGRLQVWDLATGTLLRQVETGHTPGLWAMACTVMGDTPVAVTVGGRRLPRHETARVWNLRTGEPKGLIVAPSLQDVAFTAEGDVILAMGSDIAVFRQRPVDTRL